jgi:hypothetical protein
MKAMEPDPPGQQRLSVPGCSRPCRQECGKHAPAEICAGAPTHLAEGRHCKGGVSARGQIPPCVEFAPLAKSGEADSIRETARRGAGHALGPPRYRPRSAALSPRGNLPERCNKLVLFAPNRGVARCKGNDYPPWARSGPDTSGLLQARVSGEGTEVPGLEPL